VYSNPTSFWVTLFVNSLTVNSFRKLIQPINCGFRIPYKTLRLRRHFHVPARISKEQSPRGNVRESPGWIGERSRIHIQTSAHSGGRELTQSDSRDSLRTINRQADYLGFRGSRHQTGTASGDQRS